MSDFEKECERLADRLEADTHNDLLGRYCAINKSFLVSVLRARSRFTVENVKAAIIKEMSRHHYAEPWTEESLATAIVRAIKGE